jgi:hypothetical protein
MRSEDLCEEDEERRRDIAMRIVHHQYYWEQRNQNESDGVVWTRNNTSITSRPNSPMKHTLVLLSVASKRHEPHPSGIAAQWIGCG